ncbi:hypothetical protein LSAT2_002769 [Lamellibrachia satsuma]|nr:hypothetical protein LSAT2_002769 [Lamellibrachia satsuma]
MTLRVTTIPPSAIKQTCRPRIQPPLSGAPRANKSGRAYHCKGEGNVSRLLLNDVNLITRVAAFLDDGRVPLTVRKNVYMMSSLLKEAIALATLIRIFTPIPQRLFSHLPNGYNNAASIDITRVQRTVIIMAAASWFPGLIVMLALLVPTSGVIDGRCSVLTLFPSLWWQKFCGVALFIAQYLIPITVFMICYGRIFIYLRSRVSPQAQTSGNEVAVQKARVSRNVLKMLVIIVVCYILCNSWNQFIFLAFNFGYAVDFSGGFYNFTVIAIFLNCCANPVIYALKYDIFQKEFRKLFFTCGAPINSETSSRMVPISEN